MAWDGLTGGGLGFRLCPCYVPEGLWQGGRRHVRFPYGSGRSGPLMVRAVTFHAPLRVCAVRDTGWLVMGESVIFYFLTEALEVLPSGFVRSRRAGAESENLWFIRYDWA